MLIAMLACWSIQGHPIYWFINPKMFPIYISDIGATNLQPLFISCSGWQGLFYVITLIVEYYLRRSGKLQYWFKKNERNLAITAIGFAIIGELGILFVSIFNTVLYDNVHHAMLAVFLVCVAISIALQSLEYLLMGIHYKKIHVNHKIFNKFMISFILKTFFVITAIIFAICFGAISNPSIGACFEWTLAFWYMIIFLIFAWDLFPAAKNHHKNAPYIKDWNKFDYYLYNKHYGIHPYEKYANIDEERYSNEGGDTLVQQNSQNSQISQNNQNNQNNQIDGDDESNYRQTNRNFTNEELSQYPLRNNEDYYPIPNGQQVPVYNQVA